MDVDPCLCGGEAKLDMVYGRARLKCRDCDWETLCWRDEIPADRQAC